MNTPPKFNSSPMKNGAWKTSLSYWGRHIFRGELLNFQGLVFPKRWTVQWLPSSYPTWATVFKKTESFHGVFLGGSHKNAVVFDKTSWNNHENMPKYFFCCYLKIIKNKFNAMSTSYPWFIWLQDSYPQLLFLLFRLQTAPGNLTKLLQVLSGISSAVVLA